MNMSRQSGVTVIELMISVVLGFVLTLGVVELFVKNKVSFTTQNSLARLQENGRFSKLILEKDIRMAGFQGCNAPGTKEINNLLNPQSIQLTEDNILTGHEAVSDNSWSPALPASIAGDVFGGTDVVVVRMVSATGANLATAMSSADDTITLATNLENFQANDVLVISDCENVDIFRATTVGGGGTTIDHAAGANTSANLSKAYQTDAQVNRVLIHTYYIKDTGRTNNAGNAILALHREDIDGNEEEMIEGIEDMQITYGLDTTANGTADTYQTANTIDNANNWNQVVSTNILQLLNTIDNVSPEAQSYTFNGTVVTTPGDLMLRRQWNNFITIRNRSL